MSFKRKKTKRERKKERLFFFFFFVFFSFLTPESRTISNFFAFWNTPPFFKKKRWREKKTKRVGFFLQHLFFTFSFHSFFPPTKSGGCRSFTHKKYNRLFLIVINLKSVFIFFCSHSNCILVHMKENSKRLEEKRRSKKSTFFAFNQIFSREM